MLITDCIQAVKSVNQTAGTHDRKTNGTKKPPVVVPTSQSISTAKPSRPSASSRQTNNSLSNLLPDPPKKSPLLTPTMQAPRSRTSPPPPPTTNGRNAPSRFATSNTAHHTPLTVQTGSAVKVESPQIASLNSPATLSAADRLAPIRAAKAYLTSSTSVQHPASNASEVRAMVGSGPSTPSTPVDSRHNLAASQSAAYQRMGLPQQQPPPLPPAPTQSLPTNLGQANTINEGVLRAIRSLGFPAQNMSSGAGNAPRAAPNEQPGRNTGHHMSSSTSGLVSTGSTNYKGYASQGYGVGTPQGTYNGNIANAQATLNQAPRPYGQWPSSSGMSGNVTSQSQQTPTSNFPIPIPTGSFGHNRGLPQRPAFAAGTPNSSMRAEPLESTMDGRRASYSNDRRRPPDDRRSDRRDRNYDNNRSGRNRYHSRS